MNKLKLSSIKTQGNLDPMILVGREAFDDWLIKLKEIMMFDPKVYLPCREKFYAYPKKVGGTGYFELGGVDLYFMLGFGGLPEYESMLKREDHIIKSMNILIYERTPKEKLYKQMLTRNLNKGDTNRLSLSEEHEKKIKADCNNSINFYDMIHEELLKRSAKISRDLLGNYHI